MNIKDIIFANKLNTITLTNSTTLVDIEIDIVHLKKGKIPTFVFAKIGTIRLFYHRRWLAKTNRLIISSIIFLFYEIFIFANVGGS